MSKNSTVKKIITIVFICIFSAAFCFHSIFVSTATETTDGIYSVPVQLWHATSDKPSMGNKGLNPNGEVKVTEGKAYMLLETELMELGEIKTSLAEIYYFDEGTGVYKKAEAGAYSIGVGESGEKQPKVFKFPIKQGQDYYKVLVDPRVSIMGDEPIEARVKVDWSNMKAVGKSHKEELIKNGPKKDNFDPTKDIKMTDKGIVMEAVHGIFDREFRFFANKITGDRAKELGKNFKATQEVNIWEIKMLGELSEIPKGKVTNTNSLRVEVKPKGIFTLALPVEGNSKVYEIVDGALKEVKGNIQNGLFYIETDHSGIWATVKNDAPDIVNPGDKPTDVFSIDKSGSSGSSGTEIGSSDIPNSGNLDSGAGIISGDGGMAGNEDITDPNGEEEVQDVGNQDISRNNQADDSDKDKANKENYKYDVRESRGIIIGTLIMLIILIAASATVIFKYARKISKEQKRTAYLDDFEREMFI